MSQGQWVDGYWQGSMQDGYPACYFDENNHFSFPWEKNMLAVKDAKPKEKHESNPKDKSGQ